MENNLNLSQHISKRYSGELEMLRDEVIKMGGLVEKQIRNSTESLITLNTELADSVISQDTEVNHFELKIDELSVRTLAKRQPAATDLRLVIAILKSISDLERIGDLAQSVALVTKDLSKQSVNISDYIEVKHLGNLSANMLESSIDAFVRLDTDLAFETIDRDNELNQGYNALYRQLITYMMEDPRMIRSSIQISNVAKGFERIGDHSKNICEHVIYLVKGEDIRYRNIEEVKKGFL